MSVGERRRERRLGATTDRLTSRLTELDAVAELAAGGPGRLPDDLTARLTRTAERARTRMGLGATHTVVALAGATGSGKSSTFNALAGAALSQVGVRRPTTSATSAVVFDANGSLPETASDLLDWLEVDQRHVAAPDHGADLAGLILLDLPDHDSTAADHRAEVDRLVEVVDAFVWVVDPQKYADAALHGGYLQRFAEHAAVTIVVLNQLDVIPKEARRQILDDLSSLLRADGLEDVRLVGASALTGEGVPELRRELIARVTERRAALARLDADVDQLAETLQDQIGTGEPRPVDAPRRRQLADAFAEAAGADAVADAVGAAHRHRAAQAVGWPPTRWIGRLRPDPLRRLGLDRAPLTDGTEVVARTSRPDASTVAEARADTAIRGLVDDTTADLPPSWQRRVAIVASARRDDVADSLDRAIGSATLPTGRPRWWSAVAWLQWVLAAVMVTGILWLIAIGVVAWLQLPDLPTPDLGQVPWPTALAIGGALAGILVSVIARAAAAVGARRRAASARRTLRDAASASADVLVIGPVDEELRALGMLRRSVLALRP